MRLKNNLKSFARAIGKTIKKIEKKIKDETNKIDSELKDIIKEKINVKRKEIENSIKEIHKNVNDLELDAWSSSVNDAIIIIPSRNTVSNVSFPSTYWESHENNIESSDDYYYPDAIPESIDLPEIDVNTNEIKNRYFQWKDESGNIVNYSQKQYVRKYNGLNFVHTTGFSTGSISGFNYNLYVESKEVVFNHFDPISTTKYVNLYIKKNILSDISNINQLVSLKFDSSYMSASIYGGIEEFNDNYYLLKISIKLKSDYITHFDENEYLIVKLKTNESYESAYINVIRPAITLESGLAVNSNDVIDTDHGIVDIYNDPNIKNFNIVSESEYVVEDGVPFYDGASIGFFRISKNRDKNEIISYLGETVEFNLYVKTNSPKYLKLQKYQYETNDSTVTIGSLNKYNEDKNLYYFPIKIVVHENTSSERQNVGVIIFCLYVSNGTISSNTDVPVFPTVIRYIQDESPSEEVIETKKANIIQYKINGDIESNSVEITGSGRLPPYSDDDNNYIRSLSQNISTTSYETIGCGNLIENSSTIEEPSSWRINNNINWNNINITNSPTIDKRNSSRNKIFKDNLFLSDNKFNI